jgi:hypothetical protein
MCNTGAYGIVMCQFNIFDDVLFLWWFPVVDPTIHMSWMNCEWDANQVDKAKDYIINLVCLQYLTNHTMNWHVLQMQTKKVTIGSVQSPIQQPCAVTLSSTLYGLPDIDMLPCCQASIQTVEEEFSAYMMAILSLRGMNILAFWMVSVLYLYSVCRSSIIDGLPDVTSIISHHLLDFNGLSPSLSYPIHPCFSSKVLDPRSDQIQCTDPLQIQYNKLFNSYPAYITLNTAYFLHSLYSTFQCFGYSYFQLCLLIH